MDPIIVLAAGIILVVTGAIDPLIKNKEDVLKIATKTKIKTFLIGESILKNLENNNIFSIL